MVDVLVLAEAGPTARLDDSLPASALAAAGVPGAALAAETRVRLDTGDAGYVELYAEPDSGMLVGAAADGPDAPGRMAEIALAIRAQAPVMNTGGCHPCLSGLR